MSDRAGFETSLSSPEDTAAAGRILATVVTPGDCILLHGPIGSGKTHLARALIQEWLARDGLNEDVPSPTFTIVQTYANGRDELWHADLYRLTATSELEELGLFDAMDQAIVLIEWPDRLGADAPKNALSVHLRVEDNGRIMTAEGPERLISALAQMT